VNGYGGETNTPQPELPVTKVGDEATLRTALAQYPKGVFRITSSELTLTKASGDLVVHAGQHIVVGGTGENVGQYSAGGPLFAITNASNILNIGAGLRLESGASLTIARGAAVNVTYGGVLHAASDANGGAKVGVGVNVSGGNLVNIGTTGVSTLWIAPGGALHIEGDWEKSGLSATLAVHNTTSASKVYLESANSALTLEKNAILAVEGVTNSTVATATETKTAAEAEADKIIGSTCASVIEIPAAESATAIGTVVTVTGYEGTSIKNEIGGAFTKEAGKAAEKFTAATTDDKDEIATKFNGGATRVTYSGTDALTGISVPANTTLIISGDVTEQDAAITTNVSGKLEITGTVTTANTGITKEELQSLVAASGGGTVVLKAAVTAVTAPLYLGTNLEIGTGGKIAFDDPASPGPAFSGSGKTVAILAANTDTALTLTASITGYGANVTVINNGKHATAAITTATTSVDVLNDILTAKGNITASATVAVGVANTPDTDAALTVPDNTALTIKGLTVNDEDSVLTVSVGTTDSTLAITDNISTNDGTIKTANAAVLATLLGKVEAGIVEVTDNVALPESWNGGLKTTVTLKVTNGKTLTLATGETPATLTVANGAIITAENDGDSGTITNNGIIITQTTSGASLKTILDNVTGNIEASGNVTALPAVTVRSGTNLTVSGTITNTGTFTNNGKVILEGTITGGTFNRNSTGTFEVSNAGALNSAVAFNVPSINLNSTFYTTETSNLIVIGKDAGDERTEADRVTITGLGKDTPAPVLNVGVQIANDYITLQDVKIAITAPTDTNSKKTQWNRGTTQFYHSAVFLGRSDGVGGFHVTGTDDPVHNVKLLNSSISITKDSDSPVQFTAGFWVDGSFSDRADDPSTTYYYNPSTNITISDNTIAATGYQGNSVQGIVLSPYHSSITITGNTVTAKHTVVPSNKHFDAPASAIYIRAVGGATYSGNLTPAISGNTIHNNVAATGADENLSVYSFYFNAYDKWTALDNLPSNMTAYDGVKELRDYKFGNYETTWALPGVATDTVYKKLFNALLDDITQTGKPGFAAVGSEVSSADYAFEQYKISEGKVTSISVHGFHINAAGTQYDSTYAGVTPGNGFNSSDSSSTKDYGSFPITYPGNVTTKGTADKFWLTYQTKDDNWSY
jgi:hypothetical protein